MITTPLRRLRLAAAAVAALALVLVAGCSASTSSSSSASGKVFQIGIAQIVSHPSLDAIRAGVKDGLKELGFGDNRVKFDEQNPQGDQATLTNIANNFKSKDLVVAITTPVVQAMAQNITDKPIIFTGVTDPVAAGVVKTREKPGGNVTGVSDANPIKDQLQLIKDIKPSAQTIGIVFSSGEVNAQVTVDRVKQIAPELGLSVKTAAVTNSSEIQQAAKSLAGQVDAFYVGNDNTVVAGLEALLQVAQDSKAIVVTADPDSVKRGAAAAYALDQYEMGKQTARMVAKVLRGEAKPATTPVENGDKFGLTINPAAADKQGSPIPDAVRKRATSVV